MGKLILSLGNRAFSSCLEKVGLIGFSRFYDSFETNQNQRYTLNLKNFDTKDHDKKKFLYQ
jgi:hypothetical protein